MDVFGSFVICKAFFIYTHYQKVRNVNVEYTFFRHKLYLSSDQYYELNIL